MQQNARPDRARSEALCMSAQKKPYEILVAEDNPADIGLVREALRKYEVDCSLSLVYDGAQAIVYINRLDADPGAPRPDLILLDMQLPKRTGAEVLRCIRSTERYRRIPVIVMTGGDSNMAREKAVSDPAVSYFTKPCDLNAFLELGLMVRHILTRENIGAAAAACREMNAGGNK
jgi:CheY-like chemotaxis protein